MAKLQFQLRLNNVGPHTKTEFDYSISQKKIGIFAMNGEGKSFISRAFAAASADSAHIPTTSDHLLSLGSKTGSMEFSITSSDATHKLSVNFTHGMAPAIHNSSPFKFLVFNSGFVKENLDQKSYSPSGDYTGYIVGREAIDISKEEAIVADLEKKGAELKKTLEGEIARIKSGLSKMGVRPNTAEYKQITYEYVSQGNLFGEEASSHEIIQQINKLKSLPEDSPDIILPEIGINLSFLDDIAKILTTSYEKASFTDTFLSEMRLKHAFIESGLSTIDIHSATECPFCKQTLSSDAKTLLLEYNKYLEGAEAKVLKQIDMRISDCKGLGATLNNHITILLQAQSEFDKLKVFFPAFANVQLPSPPSIKEFDAVLEQFIADLSHKKENITTQIVDGYNSIETFNTLTALFFDAIEKSNEEFSRINSLKRHIDSEQLALRRRLCKAKYNELIDAQRDTIRSLQKTRDDFQAAKSSLKEKLSKMRTPKAALIAKTFSELVSHFFADKYTVELNDSTFSVIFKKQVLGSTAPHVLSDGEKNIMAFCYFLASVHKSINEEDDYSKLFLIIDDPISSMDFNYVYAMGQTIRSLKKTFPKIENEQYIILTHSIEFMGILCRSNILPKGHSFTLHNGRFAPLKGELLLPYEAHLRDIYNIAVGAAKATHTTGNSIRHILETLWRFERPDLTSLKEYLDTLDEITDKSFLIYTLSNDLSHGVIRSEFSVDEATIQKSCFSLIEYMKAHYSGQIKHLEAPV